MISIRRPLSALFALLYLLLAAGGEALAHEGDGTIGIQGESHYHAAGDEHRDCPPPPHDEAHCPACSHTGLRFTPTQSVGCALIDRAAAIRMPPVADALAPALRSHAPPGSRAPPLG